MGGGAKTEELFPQNKVSQIKMDAPRGGEGKRGEDSLWGTSGFSAFDNTVMLARSTALAHVLARRKVTFHLIERTRSGLFELGTRIRQEVRTPHEEELTLRRLQYVQAPGLYG